MSTPTSTTISQNASSVCERWSSEFSAIPACVLKRDLLHYRQHALVSLWGSAYAQISGGFLFMNIVYTKPALTVEAHLRLLESRGMTIEDRAFAERALTTTIVSTVVLGASF